MSSKTLTAADDSPPATDSLAPELEEPYRRLLRVLRASTGMFALVPVESDLPSDARDRLLERLRRDVDALGRELRVADLFYETWDPLHAIEGAWKGLERPAVVVLRGLERTPPAPLGMGRDLRPSAFARLNQTREHIEQRFPEPLIVWCEPETFGALQRYAPDFFDHFSGLVRFGVAAQPETLEVREPAAAYDRSRATEVSAGPAAGCRSALRFYEARIAKSVPGSPERARALLGLAEALAGLPGSEEYAAAEQALEAVEEALCLISAEEDPTEWARALRIEGSALRASQKLRRAKKSFSKSLEAYRRLARENPEAFDPSVAPGLVYLGLAQVDLRERDAARRSFEEALDLYRRLAHQHPAAFEPDVAMTLNNLGNVLRDLGERDAARQSFEEALDLYRRLAQQHPAAFVPYVAGTLNNLGTLLGDLGERDAARQSFEEALDLYRRLAHQHPAAFEPDVAMTLHNLGTVLADLGERDAAGQSYEEALDVLRPLAEKWPDAFGHSLRVTLRNYVSVTDADEEDRWQQLWQELQTTADGESR